MEALRYHHLLVRLAALEEAVEKALLMVLAALQVKVTQGAVAIEPALITQLVEVEVQGLLVLDALPLVKLVMVERVLHHP